MIVKGWELPAAFADLAHEIEQGGTWSFLPIGKFDAYGNFFDVPLVLDTAERDLQNWTDETYSTYAVPDLPSEELEEMNAHAESEPGGIPYITDFSQIVGFGWGQMDYPFCFDFRDNPQEPSVIFLDHHHWRRVAPNFKEFMRLYRPSTQATSRGELWLGISTEDMDRIARTEEALAKTVFQGEPRRQIPVQICSGLDRLLDRAQIETIEAMRSLNAYVGRLVELGHEDIADAFQSVMEAVMHCEQLSAKQRHSLLHHVEWLSGQALFPPDKRVRPGRIESNWSSLASGMGKLDALAEVWQVWGPKIGAFFGF